MFWANYTCLIHPPLFLNYIKSCDRFISFFFRKGGFARDTLENNENIEAYERIAQQVNLGFFEHFLLQICESALKWQWYDYGKLGRV